MFGFAAGWIGLLFGFRVTHRMAGRSDWLPDAGKYRPLKFRLFLLGSSRWHFSCSRLREEFLSVSFW